MTLSTWPPLVFVFFPIIYHLGHPLVSLHNNGFCPDFVVNGVPLSKNLKKYDVSYSKREVFVRDFLYLFHVILVELLFGIPCVILEIEASYFMWSIIITLSVYLLYIIHYMLYSIQEYKSSTCVCFVLSSPRVRSSLERERIFLRETIVMNHLKILSSDFFVLFFFYEKTILH